MAIMKHTLTAILILVCFGIHAQTTVIGNASPLATNIVKGSLQVDSAVKLSKFISSDTSVLLVTPLGGVIRIPKSFFAMGASVDTSLFARKTLVFGQTFDSVLSHGALTSRAFQTASGGSQVFISPTLFIRAQSGSTEFYVRPTGVSFVPNNSFPSLNTSFTFINPSTARIYNFRDKAGDVAVLSDIQDTASTKLTKGGDSPTDTLKYGTLTKQPITTLVAGMPRHVIDTSGNTVDRSNIKFTSATTSMRIYNDSISATTSDTIYANSYILTDLAGTGKHYVLRAQKRGSARRFTVDTGAIVQATNIYDTVGGTNSAPVLTTSATLTTALALKANLTANTFTAGQTISLTTGGDALSLRNSTVATMGNPQFSPMIHLIGSLYNQTTPVAKTVDASMQLVTASASTDQYSINFGGAVNGGAISPLLTISNAASSTLYGNFSVGAVTSTGNITGSNGIFSTGLSVTQVSASTALQNVSISRTGVAGSLLKMFAAGVVVDSVYNDGSIYSGGTINIAGTGTSKINGPLNYTAPTTTTNTDSVLRIKAGVISAGFPLQSTVTATGNTTISIPADTWVGGISILPIATETIKIGTSSGAADIVPSQSFTGGVDKGALSSPLHFVNATTLFIQGATGSVTYFIKKN